MRRSPQWGRPWSTRGSCTWACSTPRRTTRLPHFSKVRAHRGPSTGSPCVTSAFPNQLCRYGYVTNSKVKFVMVVDSSNTALRDNEIRSMFRKLHNSYTDVMCNPFYNPGDRIQSRAFDNMVTSMMIQVC
ncbi:TRAPPC2L isoform 12 [Pan troglodytes]|uniref:Trafficking protein particle complex subunit 2L n=2 Tax=Homininae TaxID=207598 RepID=H3BQQ8_HUMAN|nr:trafficking protein particle complex subunit 2-like protein isoform 4 [Homo sapiens]XP_016878759.1 trafficking protein particle complex subunit 2-like protein isoform X1 [Homo sapiens]XP_054236417.1 trafficking protein particle complex subunit 2-like protein isoform X1 [Homo sapiens]XP_054525576.1 trafficking protein particle complex subunit 2-like protein isoform X7 [Pan troglodytes]KAI2580130.1 trafficking protein particle complex subunit 2L [Homo sapiens]KAI4056508.1 trafficking protein |eukprot:NP_001305455.1 trafficking protein particle complex subunit 2-like protein isoform 4 [Homo sapiens]